MLNNLTELFDNLKMEFSPKCLSRFGLLIDKPRLLILVIINIIILWNSNTRLLSGFILSLIIYFLLIRIALSEFPEKIFRLFEDVRRVATQTEKDRLIPLFNEVYEKVKEKSHIGDKVRLYIVDQMLINASAVGKNTIVVTRGLMSTMSDEQIKGILAHEFAHIVRGDTQVSMFIIVTTNIYIWVALLLIKLLSFIESLTGANSFVGSLAGFIRTIIDMAVKCLLSIITVLVSTSSRRCEYKADKIAKELGYGESLLSALYKLYDMEISDKKNLIERMKSSHPKLAYRIEKLEKNEN